jgi:hypothetical protein
MQSQESPPLPRESSLIVTTEGNTLLDRITRRIYHPSAIRLLNTPIVYPVNLWSLLHVLYGSLARRAGLSLGQTLTLHHIFEAVELFLGEARMTPIEALDTALDTAMTALGHQFL